MVVGSLALPEKGCRRLHCAVPTGAAKPQKNAKYANTLQCSAPQVMVRVDRPGACTLFIVHVSRHIENLYVCRTTRLHLIHSDIR